MQIKSVFCLGLLAIICFASCSKEESSEYLAAPEHELFIRFVSPTGTNILDSLGIGGELYSQADLKDIQVKCITTWNDAEMNILHFAWRTIPKDYHWKGYGYDDGKAGLGILTEGTALYISWGDLRLITDDSRPKNYETSYVITLKSLKVFGSDETHTIKWDVRVTGKSWDAYRCEVDGKEYSVVGDAVYDFWSLYYGDELPSSRRHLLEAQVTIRIDK